MQPHRTPKYHYVSHGSQLEQPSFLRLLPTKPVSLFSWNNSDQVPFSTWEMNLYYWENSSAVFWNSKIAKDIFRERWAEPSCTAELVHQHE